MMHDDETTYRIEEAPCCLHSLIYTPFATLATPHSTLDRTAYLLPLPSVHLSFALTLLYHLTARRYLVF